MQFEGGFVARKIDLKAGARVTSAIAQLGRTEDLNFSPNGKRLAIAGFLKSKLLILDVELTGSGDDRTVIATQHLEIHSPQMKFPHGVAWIDQRTLVVANRRSDVCVFRLPARKSNKRNITLHAVARIKAADCPGLSMPSSVAVSALGNERYEVLICSNDTHTVSRHILSLKGKARFLEHRAYLRAGFNIPDGVANDAANRIIAVSNHHNHCVDIFDATRELDISSTPSASLAGLSYPHGLRFSADSKFLAVADAAEPFIHVFRCSPEGWQDQTTPVASIRVMDQETFIRGYVNPEEGGPKGLDLWGTSGVCAITSAEMPIAFFDLSPILGTEGKLPDSVQRKRVTAEPAPQPPAKRRSAWAWLRELIGR